MPDYIFYISWIKFYKNILFNFVFYFGYYIGKSNILTLKSTGLTSIKFHEFHFIFYIQIMFLKSSKFNNLFKEITEVNFLYYAWLILKRNKKILKTFSHLEDEPIAKTWFINTSFLLKNGLYNYSRSKVTFSSRFNYKRQNLGKIKNQIVQMSFFLGIFPYFEEFYKMRFFHLRQCL